MKNSKILNIHDPEVVKDIKESWKEAFEYVFSLGYKLTDLKSSNKEDKQKDSINKKVA